MSTLLSDIEAFTQRHSMSEYAFGEAALNDRHLIRQLRAGRELRRRTEARVVEFMKNPPVREEASRPSDVGVAA